MRSVVARTLRQRHDLCLLCAFRQDVGPRAAEFVRPHRRYYRSTGPSGSPAGAAAAHIEDDETDAPAFVRASTAPAAFNWKCQCGHLNASHRTECTLCLRTRPAKPELVTQDARPRPSRSQPPPPAAPAKTTWERSSGSPSDRRFAAAPAKPDARSTFDQPNSRFAAFGPGPTRSQGPGRSTYRRGDAGIGDRMPSLFRGPGASAPNATGTGFEGRRASMEDGFGTRGRNGGWPPRSRFQPQNQTQGSGLERGPLGNFEPRQRERGTRWGQAGSADRGWSNPTFAPRDAYVDPAVPTTPSHGGSPPSTSTSRGTNLFRPLVGGLRQPDENPRRDARPSRSAAWAPGLDADPQSLSGEDGLTFADDPISDMVAVERPSRKPLGDRDPRERRSRMYEMEADSPLAGSKTASTPLKSRRKVTRSSTVDFDLDDLDYEERRSRRAKRREAKEMRELSQPARPVVQLPEFISVERLAQSLKVRLQDFMIKLEEEGFEDARYDHILDAGTSAMLADLYGFEAVVSVVDESGDITARRPAEDPSLLPPRPPVVTIMGHVDHGKTTILDYFRRANVVASEHGGITQHIGAFSVSMPGSQRNITFLDTPGHAAFLDMRRRGATVTDIVVLVVAADDSVKAQTIEAIKHALEAQVQIIVAINKVDKEDANVEKVKQDLTHHGVLVEDYGGDFQAVPVSGKTGRGMADLEEAILALADVADFRAETDGPAEGWIIESTVGDAGRVATVLVRRGTLRPGDFIVAGTTWARIRTLRDDSGQLIDAAPPGTPVQIDGWRGADPVAGWEVLQADSEQHAKEAMAVRLERDEAARAVDQTAAINEARSEEAEARAKVLAWEKEQGYLSMRNSRRPKDNEGWVEKESTGPRQIHFLIKADVTGSTEALVAAVAAIGNHEIRANVIHGGTGELTESDVKLLAATGELGYLITFNQPVDVSVRRLADAARLQILDHNIIYKVTDDVTEKLSEQLPPRIIHRVLGEAEVGQIFDITVKRSTVKIAGCRVTNGVIHRAKKIRVSRAGHVVYTGTLNSFKNIKKDVTEMRKGSECGMGFDAWADFQVGDQIQSFEEIREKRTLY